jgi:Gram-negative bacterial TonB protein C-terminal
MELDRFRIVFVAHLRSLLSYVLVLCISFCLASCRCQAQGLASSLSAQQTPILSKLSPIVYPPLALQARITGEVKLTLHIRKDGSVESIVAASGHPLLIQPAKDSALKSQFDCSKCKEEINSAELTYTFELSDTTSCCSTEANRVKDKETVPRVVQIQNHVTVIDQPACICDPPGEIGKRPRSIKCLYLWRCAKTRYVM